MTNRTLDSASFTSATAVGLTDVQPLMVGGVQQKITGQLLKKEYAGPIASDTYANIVSGYAAASYSGYRAWATDIGIAGADIFSDGTAWRPTNTAFIQFGTSVGTIIFNTSGCTYSQTATTVTVTATGHGLTADANGATVHLTQSTGALTTGYFTGFTYVDANTFTCTSSVSQSTSGNLGANAAETFIVNSWTAPEWRKLGINMQATYIVQGKSNTNTKTGKYYYSGIQNASNSTLNTAANSQATINTPTNIRFLSSTTFQPLANTGGTGNGLINTESTTLFTASATCATAGDWMYIIPSFLLVNWRV